MKKLLFLILTLLATPLFARNGYCLDSSKHLKKAYDNKEWHYVECYCECNTKTTKDGHCLECGHLQDAHPLTIIRPTLLRQGYEGHSNTQQSMIQSPKNLQDFVNNRIRPYLQSR